MSVDDYVSDVAVGDAWQLVLGDACEELPKLPAGTVDLSVHSPPFDSLYTYSDSVRDLGNSATREQFLAHYSFVVREMLRLTRPGRIAAVHVMDLSTTLATHGVIGLSDFSSQVRDTYEREGWIYAGRITIRKNPQATAVRTKAHGLMFVTLKRDRAMTRPVHPDYLMLFRKPGNNAVPINSPIDSPEVTVCVHCGRSGKAQRWAGHVDGVQVYACVPNCVTPDESDPDNQTWIRWAEAIWDDIRETDTLNVAVAREDKDERHICPLALPLIERCVRLWSNPGETLLTPFAGIGSEVHQAVKLGRRAIGVELKPSYWKTAVENLRRLDADMAMATLFDSIGL